MSDEENEISSAPPEAASSVRPERSKASAHTGGFFDRTAQFLRDTRAEMRRVSWPSFSMVKNTTIITVIAVIFFAVYLFAVDRTWAFLLTQLDKLLHKLTGAA